MKKARGACATDTQSGATGSKGALQFLLPSLPPPLPPAPVVPLLKDLVILQVAEWYDLGLQLGVEDEELNVIKKNNPGNLRACKREMFRAWLRITPNPSYQQLVEALTAVGDVKEADQLSKKYGKEIPVAPH